MENLGFLLEGFATAATPMNLLLALIGVLVGTAVGVLPGIGPAMTVALLLPVTYGLEPTSAMIMFAGIFYGGMYGGSTTSILLNTPGESSSVVTAIEGNLMAKAGKAAQALATAAIGSFVAGTIGTTLLVVLRSADGRRSPSRLGAPEYFAIMLLAFVAVTAVLGASRLRGFIALVLGLTIGLIGIDAVSGQARLTFGIPQLGDGIDVVVVAVGIFAVGEALWVAAHLRRKAAEVIPVGRPFMGKQDWKRSWKPWLRGTAFGFPFGAMPAGGAEIPTFLSYITEKRLTKHPEEFGKGAIEGVAGPEAANNASAAGTMVPMLSLGLPTNATAAVMLAALTSYGIQPGPLLLQREGDLVWALIASLFIGNLLLLVLNLPLAPVWAKLLRIPRPYLYAGILFFASMGAYAVNGSNVRPDPAAGSRPARLRDAAVRPPGAAADRRRHPRPPGRAPGPPRPAAVLRRSEGSDRQRRRGHRSVRGLGHRGRGVRDHRHHPALAGAVQADQEAAAGQGRGRGGAAVRGAAPRPGHRPRRSPDGHLARGRHQAARSQPHGDPPVRSPASGPSRSRSHEGEPMTIVVGFSATAPGRAALTTAVARGPAAPAAAAGDQLLPRRRVRRSQLRPAGGLGLGAGHPGRGRRRVQRPSGAARQGRRPRRSSSVLAEVGATLCVIGLRKRSQVGKMLLGSNAHRILMEAPCPVLSVRPDDHEES